MNMKLQALERRLAKAGVAPHVDEGAISNRVLSAMQSAVEAEAEVAIAEAQAKQKIAEAEVEKLRGEVTKLHRELEQARREERDKIDAMHVSAKQDQERMSKTHAQEMQELRAQLATAQQTIASEQQARVRAEVECKEAVKMHTGMEKLMAKLQSAKPVQQPANQVIVPQAAQMKPLTMTVSQRDPNGRIVAISIVPTT